ncbi:MAG: beta-ketoacyl-[acyl-carrier-protein] synthase II [Candidatus Schekmanbacteria bacterium]|nr:MAG: beta-ketoacyl-[acyl-carrier-protein] synthase II [Candidatus Schekmanbacteria bacterium]
MSKRRVVVTGVGIISPIGIGEKENLESLRNGKSGITRITHFDPSQFSCQVAAEVKNFDATQYMDSREAKKMDIFIQFAVAASVMAMKDSGLEVKDDFADRVGVIVGSGIGGMPLIEHNHKVLLEKGPRRISPFFIPQVIINLAPGHIAMMFNAKGPNSSVVTACASATHSIGEAFRSIQRGEADVMITGGTEAVITPLAIGGFCSMKALTTQNDNPEKASKPFDKNRDGFIMGEGSGILILEELEFAKKRGANIRAEICGFGQSCDAYHMTSPSLDGDGAVRCMEATIKDAEVNPEEVSYINAHGTSTPLNDKIETTAIKNVFKDNAYKIPVSSTKSMTGHLLGAAGAIESVFSVLSIEKGFIPPTINYEEKDPECDLDYVPNEARDADLKYVLSNSFGFGGTNACLMFKKFED